MPSEPSYKQRVSHYIWMTRQWSLRIILTRNEIFRLVFARWSALWNQKSSCLTHSFPIKNPRMHFCWLSMACRLGRKKTNTHNGTSNHPDDVSLSKLFSYQQKFKSSTLSLLYLLLSITPKLLFCSIDSSWGFKAFCDLGVLAHSADYSSFSTEGSPGRYCLSIKMFLLSNFAGR